MKILLCSNNMIEARQAVERALAEHHYCVSCDASKVSNYISEVDVIVPFATPIDTALIQAGSFGLIQQFGVGVEKIDVEAATAAGVWVANVPAALYGNADSVAEHAIMLMLALARRLNFVRNDIKNRLLSQPPGQSLLHKTCCLIGLGDIGTEIARRLNPFGMRLIVVRRNPDEPVYADLHFEHIYSMTELPDALARADYIIMSLPQTPETFHFINSDNIKHVKTGAFLVNVGRGSLIDPDALLEALNSGQIAGAGLDVFWEEPVDPDHPLFACNVIATPHVAGITDSSCRAMAMAVAENVTSYERGIPPKHPVNQLSNTTPVRTRTR